MTGALHPRKLFSSNEMFVSSVTRMSRGLVDIY
jgi:hypothetical protein